MSQLTLQLSGSIATPLDSTTYYSGIYSGLTTTADLRKVYMPANAKITIVSLVIISGTTVGTAEDISMYIRLNNATDYLVATVGVASEYRRFAKDDIHIHVVKDDYIEVKVVTPAWVTNPTGWFLDGYIILDLGVSGVND